MSPKEDIESYTGVRIPDVDPRDADQIAMAEGIAIDALHCAGMVQEQREVLLRRLHSELGGCALQAV